MDSQTLRRLDGEYIAGTYNRFDVAIRSGKGSVVTDFDGKNYIDLGSGIAVNCFGHCDDEWRAAVTSQLCEIPHASNLYTTEPQVLLARELCLRTGMKKVFFSNSGAEANECAIKTARKYSHDRYGDTRDTVIALENSFHGRTITTLSATGQPVFHTDFAPFTPGFAFTPANDAHTMVEMIGDGVCAVIIELIQGEGGVNVLSEEFVKATAEACAKTDTILIIDEVQTGNGRCGSLYLYEQYGIAPDIVSTAKGLGGGLPIGATLFGKKCEHTLGSGKHGSTFGGNPVCCAGALNIIRRLDSETLDGVSKREQLIRNLLEGAKNVESISGKGLLLGIKTTKAPSQVINACIEKGVLVLGAKDKIRLLPPLNIPEELLAEGIGILKGIIAQ